MKDIGCKFCGKDIPVIRRKNKLVKYCSFECAKKQQSEKRNKLNNKNPLYISTGKTGAISELIVTCDLLRMGYDVFGAVSQSCSCDLMAIKDGNIKRIEVKTGYYTVGGKLSYATIKIKDEGLYDIIAVVANNEIEYLNENKEKVLL